MIIKCDNCRNSADYIVDDFGSNAQMFCKQHLPLIYKDRAKHGMLKIPMVEETVVEEVATPKKKKKAVAEEVVEEAVVDAVAEELEPETVVELEAVADEQDNENSN